MMKFTFPWTFIIPCSTFDIQIGIIDWLLVSWFSVLTSVFGYLTSVP